MSKKSKIIIGLVFMVILLLFISFYPYSSNQQSQLEAEENKPTNQLINNSGDYYIEEGFELIAKSVKPALENYAKQDKLESLSDRNQRLSKYFTDNSPVFDYETEYISPTIKKTESKITSVTSCADQEGEEICTVAMAEVKFYSNDGSSYSDSLTYLIFIENDKSKTYKVIDIRPWEI